MPKIQIDSSEFLTSPWINYLLELNESSAICQKRHSADDKVLSAHNSLSIWEGIDSSLSGKRSDQRVWAPREQNSQGSIPASRTPVIEHNETHWNYQSILAILELKYIINSNSLPFLIYFSSSIHSFWKKKKENKISMIDGCFLLFLLHYNYGLEGYQLNVSNYRMLQN